MFLGLGKPYFLGIDFGTSAIKAVELSLKGTRPVLVNYGDISLATLETGVQNGAASYDTELVVYLRALIKKMRPKSSSAYIAMPAFIGLISLIEFPEMREEELQEAIQFEAHKYIPSSLDEVALSWEIVGTTLGDQNGKGKKMEILLVAALKKEVERYENYTSSAHMGTSLLELETFSLVRSVVGDKPGLFLVIDMGARATNLVFVSDGRVKVSRNLDTGGKDITHTIMEGLNITFERAETLKKSGKDFLNSPESAMVFPALQTIGSEAERLLTAYLAKYPGVKCQGVILSGGTAGFAGIAAYFSNILHLPVSMGNPWERISYAPALAPAIAERGTAFSVAIGLALSGIDALTKKKEPQASRMSFKDLLHKKL